MKKIEYGYDFDRAIVGVFNMDHLVYSYDKMLEIAMEDISNEEDAREMVDTSIGSANVIVCKEDITECEYIDDERPIVIDDFDPSWYELIKEV